MLIGLTGRNASGKGEVAKYLEKKSFYYCSLSDVIRDEIRRRAHELSRENMIETGNELRQKFGPGVLAHRILEKIEDDKHYIVDSIRNPAEVEALRTTKNFKLIRVTAPIEVRFERLKNRGREGDPTNFERFRELEQREMQGNENSQNLLKVEAMADEELINDGVLETLYHQIDRLIPKLMTVADRPGWDEYFMNVAKVVASRSNCMKRKVAAIIV